MSDSNNPLRSSLNQSHKPTRFPTAPPSLGEGHMDPSDGGDFRASQARNFRGLAPYSSNQSLADDLERLLASREDHISGSGDAPRSPLIITCCCGRHDCENLLAFQNSMRMAEEESRLAAELGQALLHRHESYKTETQATITRIQNQNTTYEQELKNLRELILDLQTQNDSLTQERNRAVRTTHRHSETIKSLTLETETLHGRIQSLETEMGQRKGDDQAVYKEMIAVSQEREEALARQIEDLRQELMVARRDSTTNEARMKKIKARYDALQGAHEKVLREQQELYLNGEKFKDLAWLKESNEKLRNDVMNLTSPFKPPPLDQLQNSHFISLIKELASANNKLKSDLVDTKELLDEAKQEVQVLQARVDELEGEDVLIDSTSTLHPETSNINTSSRPSSWSMERENSRGRTPGPKPRQQRRKRAASLDVGLDNWMPSRNLTGSSDGEKPRALSASPNSAAPEPLSPGAGAGLNITTLPSRNISLHDELTASPSVSRPSSRPTSPRPHATTSLSTTGSPTTVSSAFNSYTASPSTNLTSPGGSQKPSNILTSPPKSSSSVVHHHHHYHYHVHRRPGGGTIGEVTDGSNGAIVEEIEEVEEVADEANQGAVVLRSKDNSGPAPTTLMIEGPQPVPKKETTDEFGRKRAPSSKRTSSLLSASLAKGTADSSVEKAPVTVYGFTGGVSPTSGEISSISIATSPNPPRQPATFKIDDSKNSRNPVEIVRQSGHTKNVSAPDGLSSGNRRTSVTPLTGHRMGRKDKQTRDIATSPIRPADEEILARDAERAITGEKAIRIPTFTTSSGGVGPQSPGRPISIMTSSSSTSGDGAPSNQNPYHLLYILALSLLERLRNTDIRALNRRLRRTFDIVELSGMSNSVIENVLVDVEALRERFRWVEEGSRDEKLSKQLQIGQLFLQSQDDFLPLTTFLQDLLAEIGKLRLTVNDLQVGYFQKIEESQRLLEEKFKDSDKGRDSTRVDNDGPRGGHSSGSGPTSSKEKISEEKKDGGGLGWFQKVIRGVGAGVAAPLSTSNPPVSAPAAGPERSNTWSPWTPVRVGDNFVASAAKRVAAANNRGGHKRSASHESVFSIIVRPDEPFGEDDPPVPKLSSSVDDTVTEEVIERRWAASSDIPNDTVIGYKPFEADESQDKYPGGAATSYLSSSVFLKKVGGFLGGDSESNTPVGSFTKVTEHRRASVSGESRRESYASLRRVSLSEASIEEQERRERELREALQEETPMAAFGAPIGGQPLRRSATMRPSTAFGSQSSDTSVKSTRPTNLAHKTPSTTQLSNILQKYGDPSRSRPPSSKATRGPGAAPPAPLPSSSNSTPVASLSTPVRGKHSSTTTNPSDNDMGKRNAQGKEGWFGK